MSVGFALVSLSEEQLGNRPPSRGKEELEEEKDTEEKPPLEAHAPDASLLPEQPAASASISACQPLQDLDEVNCGTITFLVKCSEKPKTNFAFGRSCDSIYPKYCP